MLDKSLYVVDKIDVPLITTISFINCLINGYNSSFFQIELISLWILEQLVLTML